MRRTFLLVENPTSGVAYSRVVDRTVHALTALGAGVECVATTGGGSATDIAADAARARSVDAVIAAGGDGTVRECASGLLGSDMPLGIIPAGTGNVLAGEIRLPRRAAGLADYLVHAPARPVTGGRANGTLFLLMAGIGLDAEIVARLQPGRKRLAGKAAYVAPLIGALSGAPRPDLHLMMNGAEHTAQWIIAARASRFGGPFRISREAGLFRPYLRFLAANTRARADIAMKLAGLAAGIFEQVPGVKAWPGTHARITSDAPVPVQIDGDLLAPTPVEISLASEQFLLIVPER